MTQADSHCKSDYKSHHRLEREIWSVYSRRENLLGRLAVCKPSEQKHRQHEKSGGSNGCIRSKERCDDILGYDVCPMSRPSYTPGLEAEHQRESANDCEYRHRYDAVYHTGRLYT